MHVVVRNAGWDLIERNPLVPVLLAHPGLMRYSRRAANELISRNQDHLLRSRHVHLEEPLYQSATPNGPEWLPGPATRWLIDRLNLRQVLPFAQAGAKAGSG
jgi:hypothetical protein